ncbi:MAG: fimbrial biogenesis chaperone [Hydrogenovibrio sp.]
MPNFSEAGLLISPTRVIFEERERSASVALVNTSNETTSYRIQFIENRQKSDRSYQLLNTEKDDMSGLFPAADIIRYSPRQVTLAPGERQTIRLRLRKPPNLPRGEYRSHLTFYQLPNPTTLEQNKDKGAGMRIFMLTGFSIPVQVWQGDLNTRLSISDLAMQPNADDLSQLTMKLNRSGDFSAVGKLTAYWRANSRQPYQEVTFLNNVAVYRENKQVSVSLNLPKDTPTSGQYKVTFTPDKAYPQSLATEATLTLP